LNIRTLTPTEVAVNNGVTQEFPEIARTYTLKRRAENQSATRQKIVEAAVDLHATVGPAHTTDLAIAERAGVTRRTFYRHFPDEVSLFHACTSHALEKWPVPISPAWRKIIKPEERLATALRELYAFYRTAGPGLAVIQRDSSLLRPGLVPSPSRADLMRDLNNVLVDGWRAQGRRRKVIRGAISHATSVATWQSLVVQQKLSAEEAVRLLVAMVLDAARSKRASGGEARADRRR
jgi:AcrR family transcriptional regulator